MPIWRIWPLTWTACPRPRWSIRSSPPCANGEWTWTPMREVRVELGARSYPVLIGTGARHRLGELLPLGAHRAALVTQENVPWTVDAGVEQRTFFLDDGEEAKDLESVETLCR